MNFKELFERLSIEKKHTFKQKVNSNSRYYDIIMRDMTNHLRTFISNEDIIVKPSVGQGNYADVPWICLLSKNTSISPSAQKGIYIVLLFNKEGDAFYLALSQGITNFKNMKLKPRDVNVQIANTVTYFQQEIPKDLFDEFGFSKIKMDLGDHISTLAKGYIQTTIVSKKFHINQFDESDFFQSLSRLVLEYEDIVEHIGNKTYDDVIELINPIENIKPVDEALEAINEALRKEFVEPREISKTPIKVTQGSLRSNKYNRITQNKIYKKTDYLSQAKENHQTGLKGEELALQIEKKRVMEMGLDPDLYVKWTAEESDSYGYDIESVDIIDHKLSKIFIEVKSTKDIKDTAFFVSKKELEVSKKKKGLYKLFRIFDLTSIIPKYYIASGELEDNFYLDPVTFSARYKYDVII